MSDVPFYGTVRGGMLQVENSSIYRMHLKSLEGERVKIVVKKQGRKFPPKTAAQLGYYWAVVIRKYLAPALGLTDEEANRAMEIKHCTTRHFVEGKDGKTITVFRTKRISEMNTKEMTETIEKIRMWAAEFLGLNIEEPE